MSEQNFDIVVLGAGSGGYAAALRASELGFSVALVEKDKVGRYLPARRLHPDQGTSALSGGRGLSRASPRSSA